MSLPDEILSPRENEGGCGEALQRRRGDMRLPHHEGEQLLLAPLSGGKGCEKRGNEIGAPGGEQAGNRHSGGAEVGTAEDEPLHPLGVSEREKRGDVSTVRKTQMIGMGKPLLIIHECPEILGKLAEGKRRRAAGEPPMPAGIHGIDGMKGRGAAAQSIRSFFRYRAAESAAGRSPAASGKALFPSGRLISARCALRGRRWRQRWFHSDHAPTGRRPRGPSPHPHRSGRENG